MNPFIRNKIKKHLKITAALFFSIYLIIAVFDSFAETNIKVVDFDLKETRVGSFFIEYYQSRLGSEDEGSYTNIFLMKEGNSKTFFFRIHSSFFPNRDPWNILVITFIALIIISPLLPFSFGAWLLYALHKKSIFLTAAFIFLDLAVVLFLLVFVPYIGFLRPYHLEYCCV